MATNTAQFNWQALIPILESAGNVAELLIPGGAAFAPLTAALEQAINPLLLSVGQGNSTTTEILAAWGALIGILATLEQDTKLDPEVLAKVTEYLTAAKKGLMGYITAGSGYDPTLYTPVAPIQ
jgi:hypothetical protein